MTFLTFLVVGLGTFFGLLFGLAGLFITTGAVLAAGVPLYITAARGDNGFILTGVFPDVVRDSIILFLLAMWLSAGANWIF